MTTILGNNFWSFSPTTKQQANLRKGRYPRILGKTFGAEIDGFWTGSLTYQRVTGVSLVSIKRSELLKDYHKLFSRPFWITGGFEDRGWGLDSVRCCFSLKLNSNRYLKVDNIYSCLKDIFFHLRVAGFFFKLVTQCHSFSFLALYLLSQEKNSNYFKKMFSQDLCTKTLW